MLAARFVSIAALVALLITLSSCKLEEETKPLLNLPKPAAPNTLQLEPIDMQRLPGWNEDRLADAIPALSQSCAVLLKKDPAANVGKTTLAGIVADWHQACASITATRGRVSEKQARSYLATEFQAYRVKFEGSDKGTFTGYYEASINASMKRDDRYRFPIYQPPTDIEKRRGSQGFTREAIEQGAIAGRGYEILWGDSLIDIFNLHIQGSAIAMLPNGETRRISYADNNGHKFKSISSAMKRFGYDPKVSGATMQDVIGWLKEHPKHLNEILNSNPRFIFFRIHDQTGPLGAQGIPLTATRSLAVDMSFIPLGVPIWLSTQFPVNDTEKKPINRLVVAQDTGAAIKGAIRGDFFWGYGSNAAWAAGRMKEEGRYYVLLPKNIDPNNESDYTKNGFY